MENGYWEDVRKHQFNSSTSKFTYGFPKDKRFRSASKILCDSFYNIPSSIGKSPKPGIGFGNKVDIAKKSSSPSPNKYYLTSDFDVTKKNLSMGKFALGRDKIKQNGIFIQSHTPAPGRYELRKSMVLRNSTSMHPRLPAIKKSYELNPGPGHYSQLVTINATGRYLVSTVMNTPGLKIKSTKQYNPEKSKLVPGPGAYDTGKQNLNKSGSFFNSRHENSRCRSFSKSARDDKSSASHKILPGPGAYRHFSDFGVGKSKQ